MPTHIPLDEVCASDRCVPGRLVRVRLGTVLAAAILILAIPGHLSADIVAGYTGGSFDASSHDINVTASPMGLGGNSTILEDFIADASGGNPGEAFEAVNWTTSNIADPNSSFIFTLQSTFSMLLTGFAVDVRSQGSGPGKIAISYQINADPIQTFSVSPRNISAYDTWETLPFTGNLTVQANDTVTFYISGYDATTAGKSMKVDNVIVTGTVPEPQTLLLVGLVLPALFILRNSRRGDGLTPKL